MSNFMSHDRLDFELEEDVFLGASSRPYITPQTRQWPISVIELKKQKKWPKSAEISSICTFNSALSE